MATSQFFQTRSTRQIKGVNRMCNWFKTKENGAYATYDDAVELIKSNKSPDTWLKIKNELSI